MTADVSVKPAQGFMMWRDGTPYGIPDGWAETKESLLIGYDLMPLRGLEVTEQVIAAKGIVAYETQVEMATEAAHDCYAAAVAGRFIPHMLGWSVCKATRERSFETTAFSFGEVRGHLRQRRPLRIMDDEETYTCNDYFHFAMTMRIHPDGRRKTTLARMRQRVEEIFERHAIEIIPIRYCHCQVLRAVV